jgi:hypothetical protein
MDHTRLDGTYRPHSPIYTSHAKSATASSPPVFPKAPSVHSGLGATISAAMCTLEGDRGRINRGSTEDDRSVDRDQRFNEMPSLLGR